MMEVMPDGSVVMLIRTGNPGPSYITRSTDNCKTWSETVKFDDVGVLPQIMTLGCGVTIASYGRPGLYVRATSDPAGLDWKEPLTLGLTTGQSCCYTSMVPLDDYTALLVYTDHTYPNEKGERVRTVLVRTVTVVVDD